jgi:Reverse transcriptase (RNA-dependent DNA polymerase).
LLCLNVLVQKARDLEKYVYLCSIDFEKAFDRVSHDKLVDILKTSTLDDKDVRIIGNLYWQVRIEGKTSDAVVICQGVRQGCILSPVLFNTYSESLFKEALDGAEVEDNGIRIGDQNITNVRYADDTVLIANTPQQLQILINRVASASINYNMKLNISKTNIMIVKKSLRKRSKKRSMTVNNNNNKKKENTEIMPICRCNLTNIWEHTIHQDWANKDRNGKNIFQ